MDSTLSQVLADPQRDDVIPLAPKDSWTGVEEALARLAHRAARDGSDVAKMAGSDFSAGVRVTEPSVEATLRPADLKNAPFQVESASLGRRATYALAFLVMTACVGVAATLAYQAYGDATQQMVASWAAQLGKSSSLPPTMSPGSLEVTAGQTTSIPAVQASAPDAPLAQDASAAQAATEMVASTPPATPSLETQQFEAMARDLAALKQQVEQLAAAQEQMAREIVSLHSAEQDSRPRISTPRPRPAAAPARKPIAVLRPAEPDQQAASAPPPPQPDQQASSVPPSANLPPPPLRPPMPVPPNPEVHAF